MKVPRAIDMAHNVQWLIWAGLCCPTAVLSIDNRHDKYQIMGLNLAQSCRHCCVLLQRGCQFWRYFCRAHWPFGDVFGPSGFLCRWAVLIHFVRNYRCVGVTWVTCGSFRACHFVLFSSSGGKGWIGRLPDSLQGKNKIQCSSIG